MRNIKGRCACDRLISIGVGFDPVRPSVGISVRSEDGSFCIPSPAQAFEDRVTIDWAKFGPLAHGFGFPVDREMSIFSTIVCLNKSIGPAAIPRLIIAVVIDAINRHAIWRQAHVSNKVPKIIPAITDGDAPPSVIFERTVIGVSASFAHRTPNVKNSVMAQAVNGIARFCEFPFEATTRARHAIPEGGADYCALRPAIATTKPAHRQDTQWGCAIEYKKTLKSLSGYIDQISHGQIFAHEISIYNYLVVA